MKALRFENQQLQLTDIAITQRAGEALVRVTTAGICNTDLEIVRGYANFHGTLGHEFVGVVEASPNPSQIGQRVVGTKKIYDTDDSPLMPITEEALPARYNEQTELRLDMLPLEVPAGRTVVAAGGHDVHA